MRAPGPTDWESLGTGGVGEPYPSPGPSLPPPWNVAPKPGVLGVGGKLSELSAMDARLEARWRGRKMPEPGTEVLK